MQVTIEVDPHKASHTASAVGPDGVVLASRRFQAGPRTTQAMLRWACQWPDRQWAIEGTRGLGRLLAEELHGHGQDVVGVPATATAAYACCRPVTARRPMRSTRSPSPTSRSTGLSARHRAAATPGSDSACSGDRRDELVQESRRTVNRLHRHLRDLLPGGAPAQLSAQAAGRPLAKARPATHLQRERKAMARDLLNDLRQLDRALADSRRHCAQAIATSGTTLTGIYGNSDVLAVKILGHADDISRFPSADHLPATPEPPPSRPPAATKSGTGSQGLATAS